MNNQKAAALFAEAPVWKAVSLNAVPAMIAMLMVLIYNLADTFFIGQTGDPFLVAAVSLATLVFLLFMAVGTIFRVGGTSAISRAIGQEKMESASCINPFCFWSCIGAGSMMSAALILCMDLVLELIGASASI